MMARQGMLPVAYYLRGRDLSGDATASSRKRCNDERCGGAWAGG
jgi:hypothetical protein